MFPSVTEVLRRFGSGWHANGDAVHRAIGAKEGSGTPVGSVTPEFEGQVYRDTVSRSLYYAYGTTSSSWGLLAPGNALGLVDMPASFTFSPAAGSANIANVTITPKNANGDTLTGVREIELWLSDAATGIGLTATSASGTVQAKSGEGTVLTALTAKKHILAQTKAAGTFVLEITDAAKTGFFVAARLPLTGVASVSAALITGNYG